MSRGSHAAAFLAGATLATAVVALAAPHRAETRRYQSLDTFAQSLTYVANQYVEPVEERKLLYAAARGMLSSLDAYSAFFSPGEYRRLREDTDGEFPDVGLTLGPGGPDDALPDAMAWPIVDDVIAGSPAARAAIAVDDRLVSIDGVPTVAADGSTGGKDERYWAGKLRGPAGTRVRVEVLRAGQPVRAVEMVRAQIKVPSVAWEALAPRVGYLSIRRFQEATSADAAAAIADLVRARAADAIILDLRTDSGGLLDQAITVADHFLDEGVIVTIRGRGKGVEVHTAHAGGVGVAARLVVLVNAETASAAEILAGALQDHHRATVVGMKTYGKGAIQTYFDLHDGSGLKLTTHRYLTPAGHQVEGNGIHPDVEVPEFEPELVVAGGTGPAADERVAPGVAPGQPAGTHDILEARLADDYQLRIAYQTAQRLLGSK